MDYQLVDNSVWVIRVTDHASVTSYFAGVCVARNSILTCAHGINDTCTVWGRRMHENDFVELETAYVRENWDLRMLRCKKWEVSELAFGWANVSEDGNVWVGSKLCHIGHPRGLVGSFHKGNTSYGCIEVHPSTFSDDYRTCKDHLSVNRSRTFPYLTMGNFINVETLSRRGSVEGYEFKEKLHPAVPIIFCQGIPNENGCFGGPVYSLKNGDVVGIVTQYHKGMTMAVHVSALKEFLVEAKMVGACGFKARFQRSIGGAKRGGGPRRGLGRDQAVSGPPCA